MFRSINVSELSTVELLGVFIFGCLSLLAGYSIGSLLIGPWLVAHVF